MKRISKWNRQTREKAREDRERFDEVILIFEKLILIHFHVY